MDFFGKNIFDRGFDYMRFAHHNWTERKAGMIGALMQRKPTRYNFGYMKRSLLVINELEERLAAIKKLLEEADEPLGHSEFDKAGEKLSRMRIYPEK